MYGVWYMHIYVMYLYIWKCSDDIYYISESPSSSRDVYVDYPVVLSTSIYYNRTHILYTYIYCVLVVYLYHMHCTLCTLYTIYLLYVCMLNDD